MRQTQCIYFTKILEQRLYNRGGQAGDVKNEKAADAQAINYGSRNIFVLAKKNRQHVSR